MSSFNCKGVTMIQVEWINGVDTNGYKTFFRNLITHQFKLVNSNIKESFFYNKNKVDANLPYFSSRFLSGKLYMYNGVMDTYIQRFLPMIYAVANNDYSGIDEKSLVKNKENIEQVKIAFSEVLENKEFKYTKLSSINIRDRQVIVQDEMGNDLSIVMSPCLSLNKRIFDYLDCFAENYYNDAISDDENVNLQGKISISLPVSAVYHKIGGNNPQNINHASLIKLMRTLLLFETPYLNQSTRNALSVYHKGFTIEFNEDIIEEFKLIHNEFNGNKLKFYQKSQERVLIIKIVNAVLNSAKKYQKIIKTELIDQGITEDKFSESLNPVFKGLLDNNERTSIWRSLTASFITKKMVTKQRNGLFVFNISEEYAFINIYPLIKEALA